MSARPPANEELPDEVLAAYRNASQSDSSRPSAQIRSAILARARSRRSAAQPWKWKVAASLAVVGILGALISPIVLQRADRRLPATPMASLESAAPALQGPVSTHDAPAAAQAPKAPPSARTEWVGREPVKVPRGQADSAQAPASASAATPAISNGLAESAPARARASAVDPWPSRAQSAARSAYPELFSADAGEGASRIASPIASRIVMVLNADGTLYRLTLETPPSPTLSPAAQLRRCLGIEAAALQFPARTLKLNTSPQRGDIEITLGVLRASRSVDPDTRR